MNEATQPMTAKAGRVINLKGQMKIPLSKATELEKRMGKRVWDGLLFNQDGITDPQLTVLPNKVGSEIRAILGLVNKATAQHEETGRLVELDTDKPLPRGYFWIKD